MELRVAIVGGCVPVEKIETHIADAVKKGAKVVTGGKRAAQGGSFFEPTVLTDVTTDMVITKEETFGPVAPLYRFKSEDGRVKMANDAPTLTLPRSRGREGRARRLSTVATSAASGASEALEYGIVGINEGIISTEIATFGTNIESRGYAMLCLSTAPPPAWAMTVAGQNGPKERRAVSARDVR